MGKNRRPLNPDVVESKLTATMFAIATSKGFEAATIQVVVNIRNPADESVHQLFVEAAKRRNNEGTKLLATLPGANLALLSQDPNVLAITPLQSPLVLK